MQRTPVVGVIGMRKESFRLIDLNEAALAYQYSDDEMGWAGLGWTIINFPLPI